VSESTTLFPNTSKSPPIPFDFTDVLTSVTSPDIGVIDGIVIVPTVFKFCDVPFEAELKYVILAGISNPSEYLNVWLLLEVIADSNLRISLPVTAVILDVKDVGCVTVRCSGYNLTFDKSSLMVAFSISALNVSLSPVFLCNATSSPKLDALYFTLISSVVSDNVLFSP